VTTQPDGYTGRVETNGPPSARDLPALTIKKLSVGSMDNNAYLLVCKYSGDALLIDAADDAGRLLSMVERPGPPVRLRGVITTHRHSDHHRALTEVVAATHARTFAGRDDADAMPVSIDVLLDDGDVVSLGESRIDVIGLRGHTPGSVALLYSDPSGIGHLFTGDSLFPGGPGKTSSPEDFSSLMDDLEERVFNVLHDSTWVYPGHGDDTTLGSERPHLAEWRARGWSLHP
jgi:glyoxylase-like metal-dependent hydrolase (beta-lactamase superfamily II)